jgi:hypothetical protein
VADENDRLSAIRCTIRIDNDGKKLYKSFRSVGVPCFWLEARHAASREIYGQAWSKVGKAGEDRTKLSDRTSETMDEHQ